MTVPVQTPRTSTIANGISTVFPFDFLCLSAEDLVVLLDDVAADTTTYEVAGLGDSAGGTITFDSAPASGVDVTVYLRVVLKRTADYSTIGDLFSTTLNRDFDRIWLALQGIQSMDDRSLRLGGSDLDGEGSYRANGNRIQDLGDPVEDGDAVSRGYVDALVAGAEDGTGFFQQNGAGAVSRTFQDKMRDIFAVPDFDTIADAQAALITAGGGTLFVPNGVTADVVPSNGVLLDFAGRARSNVFQESGETTWHSMRTLRGGNGGVHTGQAESLMSLEWRPAGSGTNGPSHADYALTASAIKHNWSTTNTVGEMDVLNLVLRQGGPTSDGVLIIGNAQTAGTGFIGTLETATSILNAGTNTITHSLSLQAGILDNVGGNHMGYFTRANAGALRDAFRADNNPGASWDYLFRGLVNGIDRCSVTGAGVLQLSDSSGNKKSLQCRTNGFEILNNAGNTSLLFLSDVGLLTLPQSYINAQALLLSGTIPAAAGANQIFLGGAIATSATAGGGQATPATVAGYMIINVAGIQRKIPYYAS